MATFSASASGKFRHSATPSMQMTLRVRSPEIRLTWAFQRIRDSFDVYDRHSGSVENPGAQSLDTEG